MDLNRRDFNRLTAAAMGGMLAGAAAGCGTDQPAPPPVGTNPNTAPPTTTVATAGPKHACRGLNDCKNKGKSGMNECAGQGDCSTAKEHTCGGQNECKHQGGCNPPGLNECAGKGGCHVPMSGAMWASARKAFAEKMQAEGKPIGEPPAPVEK